MGKKHIGRVSALEIRKETGLSIPMCEKIENHNKANPFTSWDDVSRVPSLQTRSLEKLKKAYHCSELMSSGATVTQPVSLLL